MIFAARYQVCEHCRDLRKTGLKNQMCYLLLTRRIKCFHLKQDPIWFLDILV